MSALQKRKRYISRLRIGSACKVRLRQEFSYVQRMPFWAGELGSGKGSFDWFAVRNANGKLRSG